MLDTQQKGELDLNDMRYINSQLNYGYNEEFLNELIKSVGGYGANSISADRFTKVIEKKVKARKFGGSG